MAHTHSFSPAAFFEGSEEGTYALYAGTIMAAQRPPQRTSAPQPVKSALKPESSSPALASSEKSDKSATAAAPQQLAGSAVLAGQEVLYYPNTYGLAKFVPGTLPTLAYATTPPGTPKPAAKEIETVEKNQPTNTASAEPVQKRAEPQQSSHIANHTPPTATTVNVYTEAEEFLFYPSFAPLRVDLSTLPPLAYSTASRGGVEKDSAASSTAKKADPASAEVIDLIVQKEILKSAPARSSAINPHIEAEEFLYYPNQPTIINSTKDEALNLAYAVVSLSEQPAMSQENVEKVVEETTENAKVAEKGVYTMDSGVDLGKPDSGVLVEPVQEKNSVLPEPKKSVPLTLATTTSSDGFSWADEVDEIPPPARATRTIEIVPKEEVVEVETVTSPAPVVAAAEEAALTADEESDGDWKEVVNHSRKKQTTKRLSLNYGSPAQKGKRNSEAPTKRQSSSVASTPIPEIKEVKERKPAATAALPPKPTFSTASPAPSPSPADASPKKTWAALTSSTVSSPAQPNSPALKVTPVVIPAVVPAKLTPSPAQPNSKRVSNAQKSGSQKAKGSPSTKPAPAVSVPPRTPTPNASATKPSPKPTPTVPVAAAAAPRTTGSPLPATSVWGKKALEATAMKTEEKKIEQAEPAKEIEQEPAPSVVESVALTIEAVSTADAVAEEPVAQSVEPASEAVVEELPLAEATQADEEIVAGTVAENETKLEIDSAVVEPVPEHLVEEQVAAEELPADSSPDEVLQGQIVDQVFATDSPDISAFNTDDDSSQQLLTQRLTQEVDEITEDEPVSMGGHMMFNPYTNVDSNGVPMGYYMPNGDVTQVPHAYYLDANGIPVMYDPNAQHYNPYAVYDTAYEAYGAAPMNLNLEAEEFVPSPIPHVNGNLSLDAEEFVPYGVDERRGSWNLNATEFVPTSPMLNGEASPYTGGVNRRPNPRRGGGANRRSMVRNLPGMTNGSHHYSGAQGYRSMSPGIQRRGSSANHSADGQASPSTPTTERVSRPTRRESTGVVHEPRSRGNRTSWAPGGPQPNVATLSDFVSKEHLAALNVRARKPRDGSEKPVVNGHESDSAATTAVASPSSPRGENGEASARVERSSSVRASGGGKGKKGKCIYGQGCINKDHGCAYFHPTEMCRYFPDCKFGNGCMYIHPKANGQGAGGETPLSAGDSE
ncbi:hypothetical protein BJ742DRAFT_308363 [Cladochytrium replicatum]|nr:hypothetical protein BJ742DRAFT_308363 [Cladochytrium replicatum]